MFRESLVPYTHRIKTFARVGYTRAKGSTNSAYECFCFSSFPTGPPEFYATNSFLTFGGGMDIRINPYIDIRAVDLAFSPSPPLPTGSNNSISASFSETVGIVVNIPIFGQKHKQSP